MSTAAYAANRINRPHEDYPKRVDATAAILETFVGKPKRSDDGGVAQPGPIPIPSLVLQTLHGNLFPDLASRGDWRRQQNYVDVHHPPPHTDVARLMEELERATAIETTEDLEDWYWDFCTVHPFLDGNGRIGGLIVAAFSHILHPEAGWLSANQ